jgi:hypothetical protein
MMVKKDKTERLLKQFQSAKRFEEEQRVRIFRTAVQRGHFEMVKFLVEQGADLHIYGSFIILAAHDHGQKEIRDYLISQGRWEECDQFGVTPFERVRQFNKEHPINELIERCLAERLARKEQQEFAEAKTRIEEAKIVMPFKFKKKM